MLAKNEAAPRHLPVAHAQGELGTLPRDREPSVRRSSETRLQAAVVKQERKDETDPYADVPCTD